MNTEFEEATRENQERIRWLEFEIKNADSTRRHASSIHIKRQASKLYDSLQAEYFDRVGDFYGGCRK